MQTYAVIGLIAIAAVVVVLWLKAFADRAIAKGGGRLTVDAPSSSSTVTLPVSPDASSQVDAIESVLARLPDVNLAPFIRVKKNIRAVIKVATKELADAIAERERARGMAVEVSPPDANEKNWVVTSQTVDTT